MGNSEPILHFVNLLAFGARAVGWGGVCNRLCDLRAKLRFEANYSGVRMLLQQANSEPKLWKVIASGRQGQRPGRPEGGMPQCGCFLSPGKLGKSVR